MDAIFEIETPPGERPGLGHGFAVFLRIVEWESDDALQVPLGALFRRGEDWAVFVAEDGVALERIVTLGERAARRAQILDGLEEGDRIVTHPSDTVTDGVTIVDRDAM